MIYSDEQLKKITTLGTLGYPASKCINILDIKEEKEFIKDFFDNKSPVFKAYQKGRDIADYAIDQKLLELAKNGDLKALEKYEERLIEYQRENKQIRNP